MLAIFKKTIANKVKEYCFLLAVLNLQWSVLVASADTVQELKIGAQQPESVTVTALRIPQASDLIADNTTLLSGQQLTLLSHSHIQESLNRIPGVNLARGNGQEYLPAIRSPVLTGAGACGSILSAIDGIAIRPSGFCNINELFDAHTEMADSIEIVRGPSTAFYGSNAMHGLINVISPKLTDTYSRRLGLELGGDHFYRIKFSENQVINAQQGFRIDLSGTHDGGYFDDSGYDQQKLTIRHEYHNKQWHVTNSLLHSNLNQETAGYVVGRNAYKYSSLNKSNPNPEAYRDSYASRLSSRLETTLNEAMQLVISPYLRHSNMAFLQHFLPGTPVEKNGQSSAGLQSALYVDQSNRWQWVLGVDVEYTKGWLKQSQAEQITSSNFLQQTIPSGKQYDYDVDATVIALFTHSRLQFNPSAVLTVGMRYETAHYDYNNHMLSGRTDDKGNECAFGGCRYRRPSDRDDSFNNFSPKLGLLIDVTDNYQMHFSLAQGFRAPQASELYRLQRQQSVADLSSEELLSAELGIKGQLWPSLSFQALIYQMKKRHVIFRDSDFFTVSDRKTKHRGLELGVVANISTKLSVDLSASYAEHRYDNKDSIHNNLIDSAPRLFSNTRLKWQINPNIETELEWLKMGQYYTDSNNDYSYPGHDILNWRTRWQVVSGSIFSVNITNIANQKYAERADYSNFSGERYFPGKQRSIIVGVEVKW